MDLISNEYRELNAELHERNAAYGASGHKWAERVDEYISACGAKTFLDYGAGKGTLVAALKSKVEARRYDPAVPAFAVDPRPADFVTCLDVLEHVEPDKLDAVLSHLSQLIIVRGFFVISLIPSDKFLADGRNAHLIVQPREWWIEKLRTLFDIEDAQPRSFNTARRELTVLVKPKRAPVSRHVAPKDWEGETVVVVASGPSLAKTDLSLIKGFKTIAVTHGYLAVPNADVMISGGRTFFRQNPNFNQIYKGPLIIVSPPDEQFDYMFRDPRMRWMPRGPRLGLADDPGYLAGSESSVMFAINYAVHRGARRIVLLGCDGKPGENGARRFGRPEQDSSDAIKRYKSQERCMRSLIEPLRERGVEVINATPGTALTIFPTMPLEKALCSPL